MKRRGGKGGELKKRAVSSSAFSGIVVPRVVGEASIFLPSHSKSYIRKLADRRRKHPTKAEAELERILNSLNGGALRGKFNREHVVSGKWIVDFFFPEIRLAIEVDGSIHNTEAQRNKDRKKDADCRRFDITVLRLNNREVLGHRDRLVEKLRVGWRAAKNRENTIIGSAK